MGTEFNSNITHMFDQLEGFVSTKTVVGEPIVAGSVTLIPLVDVYFGMGGGSAGTDETTEKNKNGLKSGGGLGAKIKPSAILVVTGNDVQLVNIKHQDSVNKLIDMIPSITSKLDFGNLFGKKKKGEESSEGEDFVSVPEDKQGE